MMKPSGLLVGAAHVPTRQAPGVEHRDGVLPIAWPEGGREGEGQHKHQYHGELTTNKTRNSSHAPLPMHVPVELHHPHSESPTQEPQSLYCARNASV